MSNFRTKLLGLAAVATAFTGLSYGQAITGCTTATAATEPSNPSLRAEGETELVADITVTCDVTAATTGTLVISVSPLVITSKAVTVASLPSNEATLIVNGNLADPIQGTVSGSSVSFAITGVGTVPNIPAGAAVTFTVDNIRVNATTATNPQVTETGIISYAATSGTSNAPINATPFDVGYVLPSLGSTALETMTHATGYTACAGNPVTTATPAANISPSFTLAINELAPGSFFKGSGAAPLGEGGYYQPGSGIGAANTATELQVTIGNLPAGSTVYLLASVTEGTTPNTTTLTATGSPVGGSGGLANYVAVTPVGGVATEVYVASNAGTGASGAQTFLVSVVVSIPANTAAQTTPITALVTYAPTGTLTGPATAVPTFAASSATPLGTSTLTNCQTTLLFPYITNATGFETGIAVTNTTTDNLATFPVAGGSAASPTNGTCTLNFYGNAAQPTAVLTPTLGAYSTAAPTVVPIYANILTSMIGSSGFSGYAIASCNFLEAHGFAFITDTTGTFSGTEGYLAVVIPNNRAEATGNTGE